MRKHFSYILLFIILFFSVGYRLYFKYLQVSTRYNIQQEIKKGIDEKNLSIIVVSPKNNKEIEWLIEGKEFRYKGLMYDIVRIEAKNNKKIYYCIEDINESNLIANYTKHIQQSNKILSAQKKILSEKYFHKNYSLNNKIIVKNIYFTDYQSFYKSIFKAPVPPPPKFKFYI